MPVTCVWYFGEQIDYFSINHWLISADLKEESENNNILLYI